MLGSNLVQSLLQRGHEVRGLVRSKEKAARVFPNATIDFVTGDMNSVAGFAANLAGCDVLFHTAAYFREYYQPGDHKAMLEKINVQGTVDLLIAAEKQGVKKAIHISSAGVIGRKPDGSAGDESTMPCRFLGDVAHVPVGPFRIAAMLRRPVILMLGVYRGGNRYDIHFEMLADMEGIARPDRARAIEDALQSYMRRLEHHCREAPYNWFNFYDYWN